MAFWSIVNLEVRNIARPMARAVIAPPTGQVLLPDVSNWSRVSFWRFLKLNERLGIRPTLSIHARICDDYERAAAACDARWEPIGHAWEQIPIHKWTTSGR